MATEKGWFKVDRTFTNSSRWLNDKPFDERSAYIDLLNLANYEDTQFCPNGMKSFTIPKGTTFRSLDYLSARWKWSKSKVRRYLNALSDDNLITLQGTTMGMLIAMTGKGNTEMGEHATEHAIEHLSEHTGEHLSGRSTGHTGEHTGEHHNKKEKKEKKDKETKEIKNKVFCLWEGEPE